MQSFPFTSMVDYDSQGYPQFDRAVDSIVLRNILKQYVSNGVFPNPSTNFQVVTNPSTVFTVKVLAGSCIINGTTGYEVEDRVLTVQAADTKDRIDTVVLRFNDTTTYRNIDLYIVKGEASFEPVAPTLTRSSDVYELGIANIFIPANSVSITQERITDTRLDSERCGYAMMFDSIDTTELYLQIQSDLEHFRGVTEADVEQWIETLKDKISKTDAAKIELEIEDITSDIENLQTTVEEQIDEMGDTKLSYQDNATLGAHNLLPYPYPDTTKTENGITYTDNGNGTVTVQGKNTVDVLYNYFTLFSSTNLNYFRNKSLKITTLNSNESVHIQIWKKTITDENLVLDSDFVRDGMLTVGDDVEKLEIRITPIKNMDVNYITIQPMIMLVSDTSTTFTRYAKTNEQLTDENLKIVLTSTLETGETTIVFSDRNIKSTSLIDIYTTQYGVSPKTMSASDGILTITFKNQQNNLGVKAVISNGMV